MCGILAGFGNIKSIPAPEIVKALNQIHHRGPDDYGIQHFNNAFLGFKRLSIIDLSQNGHQPMCDEENQYFIIFNGEIYNHNEIRLELIRKGITFKSSSDTEVILKGYKAFGEGIVTKLEGMFSFVIYNTVTEEVFAARDRMGKKPLLYFQSENVLFFFSELKQITQFSCFKKDIDYGAISDYLSYGSIPSPSTIFKYVKQVESGNFLKYSKGKLQFTKYWQPTVTGRQFKHYNEAVEETRDIVTKSIKKRMISDVPLGAFLSGGVDSSIITAVMSDFTSDIKTYSINYANAPHSYDESYYANLIVERYGTKHHTIKISPEDVYGELNRIIWHMDQPSCDAINTYFVSKSAKSGVTVSLSGVGGDEIFAGYSTFKFSDILSKVRKPKKGSQSKGNIIDKAFYKLPATYQLNWKVRVLAGAMGAFPNNFNRYNLIKEIYRKDEKAQLFHNFLDEDIRHSSLPNYFDNADTHIQQITSAELNFYLKNTLLRDTDVMGMAHSLEIRCPFVDHSLIEYALSLPDDFKIKGTKSKIILKDAFKDYLPNEILNRKKMGFAFPLSTWLKTGNLKNVVDDCLSSTSIKKRGIFNPFEIEKVKLAYFSLNQDNVQTYQLYQKVWMMVVLELWFRNFID